MRIGVYGDVHLCNSSSIIRQMGDKYSKRIENCINSINWAEKLFIDNKCDFVVNLGDFFDKNTLSAEELTATNDIVFNDLPHYILVGNHEIASLNTNIYNSVNILNTINNFHVISKSETLKFGNINIGFLPYTQNYAWPFEDTVDIVFSHNDIKGINYGSFVSDIGYNIDDIEKNVNAFFINGHMHNGGLFCNNGLNVGNLTGQNFNEDAFKYNHNSIIIDTDKLEIEYFENPYAFNFYKISIQNSLDLDKLENLKNNAVISLSIKENLYNEVKKIIDNKPNIVASRLVTIADTNNIVDKTIELSVDHFEEFRNYVLQNVGDTTIIREELMEIL